MSDSFDIDPDLVRKLADLLNETGLGEIEYEDNGKRVRVALPGVGAPAVAAPVVAPAAAPVATPSTAGGDAAAHPGAVTSPMVGTVYLSGQPGDPPFVQPGDTVKQGDTLLIIEAMKVMNPIQAPRSGTVKAVMVDDAQPVEFGDPLVVLA